MAGDGGGDFFSYVTEKANRRERKFKRNLVFVIMPFSHKDIQRAYSAINEECSKLGLTVTKAGEEAGTPLVILEISRLIRKAEFIVCDLTYERPNVYYELGYAHGVGNGPKDIVLIAKVGTKLHFDIAPLQVQYYSSIQHLRSIISDNFSRMMGRRKGKRREGQIGGIHKRA